MPNHIRTASLLAALFFAVPVLAADADLSVSIRVDHAPFRSIPTPISMVVENHGPARATNIVVTSPEPMDDRIDSRCKRLSGGIQFRCSVASLEPGESTTFRAATGILSSIRPLVIPVSVSANENDPNLSDNQSVVSFDVIEQSSAMLRIELPPVLDRDLRGIVHVTFENRSSWDATDAYVRLFLPSSARLVRSDPALACTPVGAALDCVLPVIPAGTTLDLALDVELVRETAAEFNVQVTWGSERWFASASKTWYRTFTVTSSGDAGAGTLRQAILDANAQCVERDRACRIDFDIDGPDAWQTIRPVTPLPAIDAQWIVIDAGTQTLARGNRHLGPEVALDGSLLREGNGLVIHSTNGADISGFAISNFPGHGVLIDGGPTAFNSNYSVTRCFIGVDPTGFRAAPNGGRGVMSVSGYVVLTDDVLSGNGRSGAFLWCEFANVMRNRIGIAAFTDDPIPNGASGIFIGPRSRGHQPNSIVSNLIRNNGEFGIAIVADAITIVGVNDIAHNGLGAIDIGLDGPTFDDPREPFTVNPPAPVIESARFDGRFTVIEGRAKSGSGNFAAVTTVKSVDLYANEAERFLGTATVTAEHFTLRYEGDLRGLWIDALALQHASYFGGEWTEEMTSELSRPLRVPD